MRDRDEKPYSEDECRVLAHLNSLFGDDLDSLIGEEGVDPVGYLIESHGNLVDELREQARRRLSYFQHHPYESLIPPTCKQDVVDLLFMVQTGAMSCRKAASLLFPQFNRDANAQKELIDG